MSKVKSILAAINASTNINNINNTNNINNKTTSIIVGNPNNEVEENSLRSSLGSASRETSLPEEIHFSGGYLHPAAWLNCKWDLFQNNKKLKLVCNIIKLDGTQQRILADLNSPHDRLWRKVDQDDLKTSHWICVKEQYKDWQTYLGKTINDFRCSKFYLPSKKGSIEIACFFAELANEYCIRMIYRATIYDYVIPKDSKEKLTIKQIQGNQIATLYVGKMASKFISLDDLGI